MDFFLFWSEFFVGSINVWAYTQVWCADQRQTELFVTAAGCIVNLSGGKQTDRKCLECAVTYQLNHEERVFQIPTTAGGHDYTQQTGT